MLFFNYRLILINKSLSSHQIEYFLRKLTEAMGIGLDEEKFAEYKANSKSCLSAWETINLVGMTYFCREVEPQTLSMGINHVFTELIMDVLKQVRQEVDISLLMFSIYMCAYRLYSNIYIFYTACM